MSPSSPPVASAGVPPPPPPSRPSANWRASQSSSSNTAPAGLVTTKVRIHLVSYDYAASHTTLYGIPSRQSATSIPHRAALYLDPSSQKSILALRLLQYRQPQRHPRPSVPRATLGPHLRDQRLFRPLLPELILTRRRSQSLRRRTGNGCRRCTRLRPRLVINSRILEHP